MVSFSWEVSQFLHLYWSLTWWHASGLNKETRLWLGKGLWQNILRTLCWIIPVEAGWSLMFTGTLKPRGNPAHQIVFSWCLQLKTLTVSTPWGGWVYLSLKFKILWPARFHGDTSVPGTLWKITCYKDHHLNLFQRPRFISSGPW